MKNNDIITFGCRLNSYESEVIRRHLNATDAEDTVVFNSCAVTADAERQLRAAIRRTRRERPTSRIVVTGCAAQVHPDHYAAMPEVDTVLGNEEKMQEGSYRTAALGTDDAEKIRVNDIMELKETAAHLITGFDHHTRAFVQIQNGCNHRCTFCIIPFGRGNNRSVPVGEIVTQVRTLVEQGYKEVVFTGVDISDYGKDLPGQPTLGQLCRRLLALVPELPRLRLSSIDAVEVDDDVLRLLAEEPRLMPHLHLSLQAGDDMILKRMKRRHLRQDAIDFCRKAREYRPDVVFGADIITGFPTETEEMFQRSLDIVDECGLTWLHVFPYSERPGTPAARMPQVEKAERKARAKRLREKGEISVANYLQSCIGRNVEVLVEKDGKGYTEHYAPVQLGEGATQGSLMPMAIAGVQNGRLVTDAALASR